MTNDKTKTSDTSKNVSGEGSTQQVSSGDNPLLKTHEGEIRITGLEEPVEGVSEKSNKEGN